MQIVSGEIVVACLWFHDRSKWVAAMLRGKMFQLLPGDGPPVRAARASQLSPGAAALVRHRTPSGDAWALLRGAGVDVRVAGDLFALGIRVLVDRDEISLAQQCLYFSTDDFRQVEPYAGPSGGRCRRCHDSLCAGEPAVKCACGLWFHQSADRRCFDFPDPETGEAATCPICSRSCTLDAQLSWSPENL